MRRIAACWRSTAIPRPLRLAAGSKSSYGGRLRLVQTPFSLMEDAGLSIGWDRVDGVVLDLGVSSMQLDEAERGFSFMRDGPLDMRMSGEGPSAADAVNTLGKDEIANILFELGEERRSRAIAARYRQGSGKGAIRAHQPACGSGGARAGP